MHFNVKGSDLIAGVNMVEKAIATNDSFPALAGIHLYAENDTLVLTANNLEIAIQTTIPCTILKPGSKIVDGRLFSELIRKLPFDNVIVEAKDNRVSISAGTMDFALNTIVTDEYPEFPNCTNEILNLTDYELERLIKNSSFATSSDDHQPIFSGVLMEIEDDKYQFIATDSNRLSFVQALTGEAKGEGRQYIIPKHSLVELGRCLPITETLVKVYSGDNQLAFHFNETIFTTRLIDGKFPNYRSVLYTEQQTTFIIKRQQFIQALERAHLFSKLEKVPVLIQLTNGVLEIGTTSAQGKSQEQYSVEQEGKDEQAAYSPKFILDMLKTMDADQVEFRFEGAKPALLKPADGDDHLYVLMPIRI